MGEAYVANRITGCECRLESVALGLPTSKLVDIGNVHGSALTVCAEVGANSISRMRCSGHQTLVIPSSLKLSELTTFRSPKWESIQISASIELLEHLTESSGISGIWARSAIALQLTL